MRRPDDCTLTPGQFARVRKEAERALRDAGALGVLPTPLDHIMTVARVQEVKEDVLNQSFLERVRAAATKAGHAVRQAATSAVNKVLGLFHASDGLVFISRTVMAVKQRFVGFHEAGHGFLPWQRPIYAVVEDCEKAIDATTAELFDREANNFASEVLFQLDLFHEMAESEAFSIWTPVRLAKKFDASNYAAIRQYVSKSDRICAVVVLNKPELVEGDGFRATLRRPIQSKRFTETFGQYAWKDAYTPDDDLGAFIPLGKRRASGKRSFALTDLNGVRHECIGESFFTGHQVFILIHATKTLTATRVLLTVVS
jgi:Zn-dependent peptidase ImmA (M78 family)